MVRFDKPGLELPMGDADKYLKDRYEVLPVNEGASWYVIVTDERGAVEKWFGFLSKAQACDWIKNRKKAKTGFGNSVER